MPHVVLVLTLNYIVYVVKDDSSRVATLDKVRSATLLSSDDLTRVKSNYIPVKTTILRQIERCLCVRVTGQNGDIPERRQTYHRNGDASITKTATLDIGGAT